MARKTCRKILIKNRQAKFLPFLRFDESFSGLESGYKIFDEQGKKLNKERIEKRKAKRKKIFSVCSLLFNLIILAIVLIVQLSGNAKSVIAPTINWKYIALLIGVVAGLILVDTLKILVMIHASTKKFRPFLAYKTSALGKYYDNITPMSTGGQPFQIFYMNKRGIRGDVATGIPLVKFIMWQITYVIICSFVLIYNTVEFGGSVANPIIITIAWIAIAVNLIMFLTVVLLSISKKTGPRIVIAILKLLSKMHIIKNYQKTFRKVMRFVLNYQKTFRNLLKKPLVLIVELLLAATDIIVYNLIPFIVCLAFVPKSVILAKDITLFKTFIQAVMCSLSLFFVPTPGSSGGAEGVFWAIFGGLFGGEVIWPVLVWRIATYYIYLLQGLLVLVYDFFVGNKKAERLKRAGAEIYNPESSKTTFKEALEENLRTIEEVQEQEQDKIPAMAFTDIGRQTKSAKEIVKNTQLVTDEELSNSAKDVDLILLEDRLRHQQRKAKQIKKQQVRKKQNKE